MHTQIRLCIWTCTRTHTQLTLTRLYAFLFVCFIGVWHAHSRKVWEGDALDNLTPSLSIKDSKHNWKSEMSPRAHSISWPTPNHPSQGILMTHVSPSLVPIAESIRAPCMSSQPTSEVICQDPIYASLWSCECAQPGLGIGQKDSGVNVPRAALNTEMWQELVDKHLTQLPYPQWDMVWGECSIGTHEVPIRITLQCPWQRSAYEWALY